MESHLEELDRLEGKIGEAAETIRSLREQNRRLAAKVESLEKERARFVQEREALAERISRLAGRVDALRAEV